jgi:hypothetical protein
MMKETADSKLSDDLSFRRGRAGNQVSRLTNYSACARQAFQAAESARSLGPRVA